MNFRATLASLLGLLAVLAPRASRAQSDVALDRYQPSPAGDALFALPDAAVSGTRVAAKVDFSYAHAPLVLTRVTGNVSGSSRVVSYQAISHQLLSLSLLSRLTLDLDLPVTWSQAGTSSAPSGLNSPQKMTLDDLRIGARLALLQPVGAWPGAALTGALFAPTGDDQQFSGAGRARYAVGVALGADFEHGLWRAFVERRRDEDDGSTLHALLGSGVAYGVGLALKAGPVQIGPELYGVTRANGLSDGSTKTNLEGLLGARLRVGWVVLGAAGGPGFTNAPGTPSYRVIGSIALVPSEQGGAHAAQPAATNAEPPSEVIAPGGSSSSASARGNDSAARQVSPVPVVTEPPPADSDGDGVPDPIDACRTEKGIATNDPTTNGCPKAVRLEGTQIVILKQLSFKTGNDVIEPESFDVLDQIARVLADHPEIARLGVDGHTDDVGLEARNLALSRRRAIAVVRALVERGVDERRLEARGFGPRRPLVPNTSPEARTKNRRVEFTIVKRTTRGSEGWTDGDAAD